MIFEDFFNIDLALVKWFKSALKRCKKTFKSVFERRVRILGLQYYRGGWGGGGVGTSIASQIKISDDEIPD